MSSKTKTTATTEEATPALVPKMRFPEFRKAKGWTGEKLGSKTNKVGSGITPTGGDKNYKLSGRPFVRSQNIGWGVLLLDDVAFIDEETHNSFSSTQINVSDVLLNITGASIGRSAVADARIKGGNVNQHVCIIRVKPDELSPFFLNQYLISHDGQKQIDSFQAGGNRQGLNFEQIRSFLIPLPTVFAEQQKIAECLSSVDELMAAQARKVDALKTHKKGLMQQLFPREGETQPRLRFPEFQTPWRAGVIDQLASTVMGNAFKSTDFVESGTQVIRIGNLYQSELQLDRSPVYLSDLQAEENSRFIVKPLDLLMSMTGTVGKRDYGFVIQVPSGCKPLLLNQRVMKIAPKHNCNAGFLLQLLKDERLLDQLYSQPGGTKQANLSAQDVKELKISYPHESEQQRVADCLTTLDDLIAAQTQKIEALKTHKKGLMQQLFPSPEEAEG